MAARRVAGQVDQLGMPKGNASHLTHPPPSPTPYGPGTSLGSMPGPEQLAWLGLREVTGEPGAGDVSLTNTVVTENESSETVGHRTGGAK